MFMYLVMRGGSSFSFSLKLKMWSDKIGINLLIKRYVNSQHFYYIMQSLQKY